MMVVKKHFTRDFIKTIFLAIAKENPKIVKNSIDKVFVNIAFKDGKRVRKTIYIINKRNVNVDIKVQDNQAELLIETEIPRTIVNEALGTKRKRKAEVTIILSKKENEKPEPQMMLGCRVQLRKLGKGGKYLLRYNLIFKV